MTTLTTLTENLYLCERCYKYHDSESTQPTTINIPVASNKEGEYKYDPVCLCPQCVSAVLVEIIGWMGPFAGKSTRSEINKYAQKMLN